MKIIFLFLIAAVFARNREESVLMNLLQELELEDINWSGAQEEARGYAHRSLVEYEGSTIDEMNHGLATCAAKCDSMPKCNSFTYREHDEVSTKYCWFKSKCVTADEKAAPYHTYIGRKSTYYKPCSSSGARNPWRKPEQMGQSVIALESGSDTCLMQYDVQTKAECKDLALLVPGAKEWLETVLSTTKAPYGCVLDTTTKKVQWNEKKPSAISGYVSVCYAPKLVINKSCGRYSEPLDKKECKRLATQVPGADSSTEMLGMDRSNVYPGCVSNGMGQVSWNTGYLQGRPKTDYDRVCWVPNFCQRVWEQTWGNDADWEYENILIKVCGGGPNSKYMRATPQFCQEYNSAYNAGKLPYNSSRNYENLYNTLCQDNGTGVDVCTTASSLKNPDFSDDDIGWDMVRMICGGIAYSRYSYRFPAGTKEKVFGY